LRVARRADNVEKLALTGRRRNDEDKVAATIQEEQAIQTLRDGFTGAL
jgi:hypothetical protein